MKGVNQLTKRLTTSSAVKIMVKVRLSMSKILLQFLAAAASVAASVFPICDSATLSRKFCGEKNALLVRPIKTVSQREFLTAKIRIARHRCNGFEL